MSDAPYLEKHILICNGDDSCQFQDADDIRNALKTELRNRNLRNRFRDGCCTCLGLCGDSVNAVIWPEGTYLAGLTADDVPRLVDYLAGTGPRLSDLETQAAEKIAEKKSKQ